MKERDQQVYPIDQVCDSLSLCRKKCEFIDVWEKIMAKMNVKIVDELRCA